ncbi:MAG TPA: hypothetical protein VGO43_06155 [Pyrinomonadaceae bacterium]|jgi:hypothetical protein|nr:hypothetical protein [Pyrinomonadaceae bacterium]
MKLAKLSLLGFIFGALALTTFSQTLRPAGDSRNQSPSVGTGGPEGGPTGLFTIYDGDTLRKGEFTFSVAYSNYDRDPGNVDITDVPGSFNLGLNDHIELFFKANLIRQMKVNNPRNLSGFYLPNSANGYPAIVLAPSGPNVGSLAGNVLFRPAFNQPFVQFPFIGGSAGTFGLCTTNATCPPGSTFGFPGFLANLGPPIAGGGNFGGASTFPGIGSPVGGILPGVVLATIQIPCTALTGNCQPPGNPGSLTPIIVPTVYTTAPSYLPDAPFLNRIYGETAFNNFTAGAKIRFTGPHNPIGAGLIAFYKWYPDTAKDLNSFNQMQRGAGPGGNLGDFGLVGFLSGRISPRVSLSVNAGYILTSNPKSEAMGDAVLLDRPDELQLGVGFDFPVNKYYQPIVEINSTHYVGSQTPNAFQQNPIDLIGGLKIFPKRWYGFGLWYRRNLNQQDSSSFNAVDATTPTANLSGVFVAGRGIVIVPGTTFPATTNGRPDGFNFSDDPNGFGFQFFAGRRNVREEPKFNAPPNIDSVTLSDTIINLPCRPGFRPKSGASCSDNHTISVATKASDADNDVLTYNYTVSGGRVVGSGANVSWDLNGIQPGSYTITTGADDGCGMCGKTNTQTITVRECPDCEQICSCGTLSVSGPSGVVAPGSPMTFTANVSGGGDVTYNWAVSAGTISSGQGTSSITVDTTGLAGQNVTATVDLGGLDPNCGCPSNASETGSVQGLPTATQIDEFGKVTNDDIKARVDGFYTQLNNNPAAQGYVINYGSPADIKARRAAIMKAIAFRKYDPSRLTFVDGPDQGTGIMTRFWLVPSGAVPPTP